MRMRGRAMLRTASILLLISTTVVAATAAKRGRGGQDPPESQEIDERLLPTAETRAEFQAAEAIKDPEASAIDRLTMTDAFLTEYPESELRHQVLIVRLQTYVGLENNQGILTSGDAFAAAENEFFDKKVAEFEDPSDLDGYTQFEVNHFGNLTFTYQSMMNANRALNRLDETARFGDLAFDAANDQWSRQSQILESGTPEYQEADQRQRQARVFFLQTVMTTYQTANDAEKTIEYAERALRLEPQNLATLLTISSVMAERAPENESELEAHFESAEEYAEEALDVLESFLDTVGDQLSAEQQNNFLSGAHLTLGTVYLNQEEWGDAIDEFEEALESVPRDAVAYLRLGMAYARDEEADDAMEALARSVFLNGPGQARDLLEQIYEARNNDDLTGIDAFIQSQGEEIDR